MRDNSTIQLVVLSEDQPYFHALHIQQGIVRLLVLYHAFWEARASLPQIPLSTSWHERFMPHAGGEALLGMWGRDMIQTSEALLVSALATPAQCLCTAPDTLFNMVTLAAGHLVGVKFLMLRMGPGRALLCTSDLLLAKTAVHLQRAAFGAGHAAQRCALLVQSMIAKWEARDDTAASYPTPPADYGFDFRQQGEEPPCAVVSPPVPQLSLPDSSSFVDVEFMFLNSMLADDTAFWNTLAADQLRW